MARKSGKDLRKEYQNLLDKTKAMQKRLIKRAEELIPQYPDVVYCNTPFKDADHMTVADYKHYYALTPMIALVIIEQIEQHIADQHPHQQQDLFKPTIVLDTSGSKLPSKPVSDFIEYHDDGDGYQSPERKIENEVLEIRLYCGHENCMTYIKGKEGYNGTFVAETGQYCDLRNQGYMCTKHR